MGVLILGAREIIFALVNITHKKDMSYTGSKLNLDTKTHYGKGRCPYDPFQRYASKFIDPTFIGIKHVTKGMENPEGDDDEIYLFFSETAVEYDSYVKLDVSRVARVCKGDVGGLQTLQNRWTSFLKAQLDCPVPHSKVPLIIKDVFLFCPGNWTTCVFYGVFTPQTGGCGTDACSKYTSCTDCVLARDPYCGWDLVSKSCIAISNIHSDKHREVVQGLKDATRCPAVGNRGYIFQEEGVWNYSTMLLVEDMGVLILGARETIFALNLTNITHKKDMTDCWNYIRIIHKWTDGMLYVCGTNAFSPACKNMSYTDKKLTLENETHDGKGKCPFDPFQRYASELVDDELYTATSINFLGTDMVMTRNSDNIKTDFPYWFNEPKFIGMKHVTKGMENPEGDDDEIYLFFSEKAVEYDSYVKLDVSRVARVCKGDVGGLRTLQKRWTSFQKAQLDCPVPHTKVPLLIKDVFLFCPGNWTTCVFYGVFSPQTDMLQYSAVCAFRIQDIRKVFSEGKFKTLYNDNSITKWVTYNEEVPDPRPGAGLLYAGSEEAAAQMPFCACSKYTSCTDCVLARDPYCGWDLVNKSCIAINSIHSDGHSEVVQSLKDGNATSCPAVENTEIIKIFFPGQMVSLPCQLGSNLARVQWHLNDQPIENDQKYSFQHDSLLILDALDTDSGKYTCISVESSNGQDYTIQTITYELKLGNFVGTLAQLQIQEKQNTLLALVIVLTMILLALVIWNFYKGHFSVPKCFSKSQEGPESTRNFQQPLKMKDRNKTSSSSNSNNNHNRMSELPSAGNQHNGDKVF
ncbi:semaphorin-4E isoform 1 precursor [Silurus meridionalis]|nr:semaphorin-4E isoform 1 precursor [Silurus meridionalis]